MFFSNFLSHLLSDMFTSLLCVCAAMKGFSSRAVEDSCCGTTQDSPSFPLPVTRLIMPRNAQMANKCLLPGALIQLDQLAQLGSANLKVVGSSPTLVASDRSVNNFRIPHDQSASDF